MSGWCDSDKNIIAELQHEACDNHCYSCGHCLHDDDEYTVTDSNDAVCWDCVEVVT